MEWIEIKIETSREAIDLVGATLLENGVAGFQIEDDDEMRDFLENNPLQWDYIDEELMHREKRNPMVTFYVSANPFGNDMLLAVKSGLEGLKVSAGDVPLGPLTFVTAQKDDEVWLNSWKKYYKPFAVGKNIVIRPAWEEYENTEGKVVFTINPGHVFGTGLHQTTRLCIAALETYVNEETVLLDLGCGSGILSIIALMLGAKHCTAVDIDANAIDIAYENADLNHVPRENYTVLSGNVLTDESLRTNISSQDYDVVVANIVADVIIGLSALVAQVIKQNGIFISSGIISERLTEVHAALQENGFDIIDTVYMDDWVSVVARLSPMYPGR